MGKKAGRVYFCIRISESSACRDKDYYLVVWIVVIITLYENKWYKILAPEGSKIKFMLLGDISVKF